MHKFYFTPVAAAGGCASGGGVLKYLVRICMEVAFFGCLRLLLNSCAVFRVLDF